MFGVLLVNIGYFCGADLAQEAGVAYPPGNFGSVAGELVRVLLENKAAALMDQASYKASALVDQTEAKVQRFTHQTIDRAARRVGLTPDFVTDAQAFATRAKSSKAMPAASILGAFAVGLTLASRLRGRGRADEEIWDDEVWEDEAEEADADWGRE